MDQFITTDVQDVFRIDGLSKSHPIYVPVHHPDEINEIFDRISYGKVSWDLAEIFMRKCQIIFRGFWYRKVTVWYIFYRFLSKIFPIIHGFLVISINSRLPHSFVIYYFKCSSISQQYSRTFSLVIIIVGQRKLRFVIVMFLLNEICLN